VSKCWFIDRGITWSPQVNKPALLIAQHQLLKFSRKVYEYAQFITNIYSHYSHRTPASLSGEALGHNKYFDGESSIGPDQSSGWQYRGAILYEQTGRGGITADPTTQSQLVPIYQREQCYRRFQFTRNRRHR
jgi:hypothetical protein